MTRRQPAPQPVLITYADGRKKTVERDDFARTARTGDEFDYDAYLRSNTWQQLRQAVLKRDRRQCTVCGARRRLSVHHLTYERVGWELLDDLTTLCGGCHMAEHGKDATGRRGR